MKNTKSAILEKFDGIILVDKPSGLTSYDILREFKKVFF